MKMGRTGNHIRQGKMGAWCSARLHQHQILQLNYLISRTLISKGLHGSFPLALLPVTHFSFLGWFYSPLLRSSCQVSKSSGIFKILGVSTTLTVFSLLYTMNSHSLFPRWAFLEELPGHTHCKVYEAFWNLGG